MTTMKTAIEDMIMMLVVFVSSISIIIYIVIIMARKG